MAKLAVYRKNQTARNLIKKAKKEKAKKTAENMAKWLALPEEQWSEKRKVHASKRILDAKVEN